ncbi:Origin recognition complex subunit 2 [Collariella sp. IMI 366227]|nr:Origin recognition complex subunit 2 [Collariella sp. IMI 366227]
MGNSDKKLRNTTLPNAFRKRDLPIDPYEIPDEAKTPKRRRRNEGFSNVNGDRDKEEEEEVAEPLVVAEPTPTKRRGRPPASTTTGTPNGQAVTPSAQRKKPVAETPVKLNGINTPNKRNIADRSARRKSARALIDRVIGGAVSDDEVEEGDIAREIYESSEDEELEADEQATRAQRFPQWAFELSQGFSACLYGYGSKRRLLHNFATYLSSQFPHNKIIIINGYVRTLTARDILTTLSSALTPSPTTTLGASNPSTTLQILLATLINTTPNPLTILLNSIDSPSLRKPALQSLLAASLAPTHSPCLHR